MILPNEIRHPDRLTGQLTRDIPDKPTADPAWQMQRPMVAAAVT
jgi:hypothetical protein